MHTATEEPLETTVRWPVLPTNLLAGTWRPSCSVVGAGWFVVAVVARVAPLHLVATLRAGDVVVA
jgi:hypothetical protein